MFSTEHLTPCAQQPDTFTGTKHEAFAKQLCGTCVEQPSCLLRTLEYEKISGELMVGTVGAMTHKERAALSDGQRDHIINYIERRQ